MPLVTAFNLRREDPLSEIEEAVRHAITSIPALEIHDHAEAFQSVVGGERKVKVVIRPYDVEKSGCVSS